MSKRKKVVLGVLVLVIIIPVALLVIVPLLFDVDRYRPQVASLIEQQTGKPAELGHLGLSIFPSLSIRVDGFTLKNPAGFPQGEFVKARRIYAVVDAGELWNHQVVIKSLDLDAPAISLLCGMRGNWNFQNTSPSTPPAPDPPGDKPLFTLGAISNVKINRGTLTVSNLLPSGQSGPVLFEADGVSSELRQVDLSAFTEPASIRSATVPTEHALADLKAGVTGVTNVAYAAEQSAKLVAEGGLDIDAVHAMNLVVTHVRTKLRLFPEQVFFNGVDLKCYDGHATGDLSIAFNGQNPQYNVDGKLGGVDVAKLLAVFPDSRWKMTGRLDGTVKLDIEANHSPDPLAGMSGSGQLTIRNGRVPGLQLDMNLLRLARLAQMGPASGDPTSFSSIAFDFTIANNRINTRKATIVGNGVDVDASGSMALAGEGSVDYQGVVKVAANTQNALTSILSGLSGATVVNGKMVFPFIFAGTLKNPKFTLKPSGAGSPSGASSQQPAKGLQGLTGLLKKKNH